MASLGLLLCGVALLHVVQCGLAARGGARRQNLLAYDDNRNDVMLHPAYYQSEGWSGRSLEEALQQLLERSQKREQENKEQRAAYLATLLRLLAKTEATGLAETKDVRMEEEDDFQGPGLSMRRRPTTWWTSMTPQLLQALLDRMDLQVGGAPPARMKPRRFRSDEHDSGSDNDDVRRLLARILPIVGFDYAPSTRRSRRDLSVLEPVGTAHRRSRRSLEDDALRSPSNEPLLRVKRLGDEEQEELQFRMVANANVQQHSGRRRRAVLNHALLDQIVNYMRK
ncbi:proprotein convertase subtilisin/kexin type 1 inhibitor, like isoform X2 [Corythoichthys intestinalis]|uniref:proprotein convertase subtilisin/kexin type 1 inhibitor, like isoform X2 n=1 Tax=Corythoichthys intestinalis TaxID=161448 RepID=UPI0025A565FF|nr:proprotein convertase subtilisin/kexin type 1 inhibitor, like isoform X2 [Corythoichthys intestinalis]